MTGSPPRSAASCPAGAPRTSATGSCRGLWDALADRGGVAAQRRGALERVHLLMADWRSLLARLAEVGAADVRGAG